MTQAELKHILDDSGIPFCYFAWPKGKAPPLPWGVFLRNHTDNFGADETVYQGVDHYQVELYTLGRDTVAEGRVESVLKSAGLYFNAEQIYLPSESCFETIYELEVLHESSRG